jgi:hypothetical protein
MSITKPHLTVVTNLSLAIVGVILGYLFNNMIIVPILFTLGIPLVNMDRPLKQKMGFTLVIIAGSLLIFLLAIIAIFRFSFDKYIFPGMFVATAALLLLLLNGLFIRSLHVNRRSLVLTFLFAGISFPIWTALNDNVFPSALADNDLFYQVGGMLLWMLFTTVGISTGIDPTSKPGRKPLVDPRFDSSQLQGQLS